LAGFQWVADTVPRGHGNAIGNQECGTARSDRSGGGLVDDDDGQNIVRGFDSLAHTVTDFLRALNVAVSGRRASPS